MAKHLTPENTQRLLEWIKHDSFRRSVRSNVPPSQTTVEVKVLNEVKEKLSSLLSESEQGKLTENDFLKAIEDSIIPRLIVNKGDDIEAIENSRYGEAARKCFELHKSFSLLSEARSKDTIAYSFKDMIQFATWYSGMEREKVVNAYNRYVLETNPKNK